MTDEILKLNSNNELIAEDPSTGNTRPVKYGQLSLPTATDGDNAPSDRAIAIDTQTASLLKSNGTTFESVGSKTPDSAGDYIYASNFSGSDADARLDNALSEASAGELVLLENAQYTKNRTISTAISFRGCDSRGTSISGDWTFDSLNGISITNLQIDGNWTVDAQNAGVHSVEISGKLIARSRDSGACSVTGCYGFGTLKIDDFAISVAGCSRVGIVLTSNSSECTVVGCSQAFISDNGSGNNLVGNT